MLTSTKTHVCGHGSIQITIPPPSVNKKYVTVLARRDASAQIRIVASTDHGGVTTAKAQPSLRLCSRYAKGSSGGGG